VRFANKNKKDEIINSMKKRSKIDKKPLLACDLLTKFINQKVFINDLLSFNNKKLRWLAKLVVLDIISNILGQIQAVFL